MDNRFFVCALLLLAIIFVRLFLPVVQKKRDLQRDLDMVEQQSREAQKQVEQLETSIDRLKNDPEYIESLARNKLGMVRKDEVVYTIVKEQ